MKESEKHECPICGSELINRLGEKLGQDYFRCRCGVVVGSDLWNQTTEEDADKIYDEKYLAKSQYFHPKTTQRYHEILNQIETWTRGRKLLEVGFGNGQFLFAANQRGWDAAGIEISEAACQWVRKEVGVEVHCGLFDEIPLNSASIDVIASMETIEHLHQPTKFLQRCHEVLKPNGILFLTTPNAACLTAKLTGLEWRGYYRGHLILFTVPGLRKHLDKIGFRTLRVETRTILPQTILRVWKSKLRGNAKGGQTRPPLPGNIKLSEAHDFRDRVEGNAILNGAKSLANIALNWTNLGDKLLIWAQKLT